MKYIFIIFIFAFGTFCFVKIKNPKELPKTEEEVIANLIQFNKQLKKSPNIYLFIECEKENKLFSSNAFSPYKKNYFNETLFSLFHAENYGSFFHRKNKDWTIGSSPLRLLKNQGYQIHNISTKILYEENIEEIIFGKDRHLTNSYTLLSKAKNTKEQIISYFRKQLEKKTKKNIFTLFLDPQKGGYKECISHLKKQNLYKNSIIIYLSNPKKTGKYLNYSLQLKLGDYKEMNKIVRSFETVFPTVLHYLYEENVTAGLYSGDSCLYSTSCSF